MSTSTANQTSRPSADRTSTACPKGIHTVTPHLVIAGAADAIEFYKKALGATEEMRLPGPNGKIMHARIRVFGSAVMLFDEMPEHGAFSPKALKGTPVTLHLYVENVDAVFAQAVAAGATPKMPVSDMFWGDRYGIIEDPFGHCWSIATHLQDLTPEQIQQNFQKMCG